MRDDCLGGHRWGSSSGGSLHCRRMPESGWFTWTLLLVPLHALAAEASVRTCRSRIAPNLRSIREPAGVTDSLLPFALALPLITVGWRVGWDMSNAIGWTVVGAPIVMAILSLGAAIWIGFAPPPVPDVELHDDAESSRHLLNSLSPAAAAGWCCAGVVVLLLGAANDLTIWVGQCAFAAGAVLLWINTPDIRSPDHNSAEARVGGGLTLMLLWAIVQAVAMGFAPARFLPVCTGVSIAQASMIAALAGVCGSPAAALRIGGWTATLALLLGCGTISLHHLLPQMLATALGERGLPPMRVAYGFGEFALEGTLLVLFGAAALARRQLPARKTRRILATLLIIGAAILAGWRLSSG